MGLLFIFGGLVDHWLVLCGGDVEQQAERGGGERLHCPGRLTRKRRPPRFVVPHGFRHVCRLLVRHHQSHREVQGGYQHEQKSIYETPHLAIHVQL